jgi:hypothetical protein
VAAGLVAVLAALAWSTAAAASTSATRALTTAQRVLRGRMPGDAGLAFRNLELHYGGLSKAQKRRADALLARPRLSGTEQVWCTVVCLHWTTSGADAPPPRDTNGDGRPDWVETTMSVLENVWQHEIVQFGFQPPKSDETLPSHGPDGRLDVYLSDIANEVLGYCAPEPDFSSWTASGYCVLDNDYSLAQIGPPSLGGKAELELTVAHEFFHSVQFGYDYGEDTWLLEGTAVWMEDEVYDSINEPYTYLLDSPLLHPGNPVDRVTSGQLYQYGAWIFWRFLEEYFSSPQNRRDPSVIRRVWELAGARPGEPNYYSLQAVDALAREHGTALRAVFAAFGADNAAPVTFYTEGANYPRSPIGRSLTLARARAHTPAERVKLDHMTNTYVKFVPGPRVGAGARLTVSVTPPSALSAPAATVVSFARSGAVTKTPIDLTVLGTGSVTVPFARGTISRVVLVLTNASGRYACNERTSYSCEGRPLDDNVQFTYRARVR